ncbi:MAG TPA: hypothetical protein PLN03_13160 [Spirochaetota bacterium]|nr:hypothetical protein [Spirochaetota bacterium]
MVRYGNENALVGITLDLRPMGPVPVTIGTGICAIVGTSARGPVEPTGFRSPTPIAPLYHAGDLKEAGELAFMQGVPTVYLVRVLGEGYAIAKATLKSLSGDTVGDLKANSPGSWGNSLLYSIQNGNYNGTLTEIFVGDKSVGPYALQRDDIVEHASNYVKVNGVKRDIVYKLSDHGAGEVLVDKEKGTITFYQGEAPTAADQISVSLKFRTRKITLYDGDTVYVANNIRSIPELISAIGNSQLAVFEEYNATVTKLPKTTVSGDKVQTVALTGGNDGATITVDDWEKALYRLSQTVTPTTVALCDWEVESGQYDLVGLLSGWLTWMAGQFRPCLGFVPMEDTLGANEASKVLDLCAGYNNRLLTIVANAWDDQFPSKNIAVARAAKEAACALGESAARSYNSMDGLRNLLTVFDDETVDVLTRGGADVMIQKKGVYPYQATRGIRPYLGISTATDWQFMRCVDNRTINWIIVAIKYITDQYYHERRTKNVLTSLKQSLCAVLDDQVELENIRTYKLSVSAHPVDTGRVDIDFQMENIGHIERFRVTMHVGVMSGGGFTV